MNALADFSLDALLTESMADVAKSKKLKESRTRLAQGNLHPEAAAKLQAELREHDMKVSWTVAANVAIFNRQHCGFCDALHIQTEGMFHRQVHKTLKTERWVKVAMAQIIDNHYPAEVLYNETETDMCEECCKEAGFPIAEYNYDQAQ
jgi:hypothetical protein